MQDNINIFIEKGIDNEPRKMRSSLFLANFFPLLGIAYGLILGSFYRAFSVMIGFSIVVAFIIIVFLTKNTNAISTIKATMCFYISTSINYLLFAMIMFSMHNNKVHLSILFLLIPGVLVAIFTIILTSQIIKKRDVKARKQRNVSIGTIAGVTTVSTYFMLKKLNVDVEQSIALLICTLLLMVLSCLFVAMACINAIKLYYIKKDRLTIKSQDKKYKML